MRRREFLAAAGLAGFSGCTGLLQSRNAPSTTPTNTSTATDRPDTSTDGTTTTTDDDPMSLLDAAVVDLQTAPRTYAISPASYRTHDEAGIELEFARTATSDHPATLRASLTNENDFANTFRIEWTPPFDDLTSRVPRPFGDESGHGDHTYRAGLVLAPTENHDLVDDPPGVELASDGYWRLTDGVDPWLPEQVRLDAGETVHGEYAVVGRREGTGRPTGVYEFRGAHDADLRLAVWHTDQPGPDEQSRFAGTAVPPISDEAQTRWYHDGDADTAVYLRPSAEHAELPAQVEFTVANKSRESVGCGHWNLHKLVDGEWFHVGPTVHTADCRMLRPGGAKTWTLNAYHGEALPALDYGSPGQNFGHLGGGRYAVVVGYGHPADRSAALVELRGDPVRVTPTHDVTSEADRSTVTATSARHGDGEDPPDATLTLETTDSVDGRVVAEQVMSGGSYGVVPARNRGLRNTLAFLAPNIDTVVLRTDERVAEQAVGYDEETRRFEFRGDAYKLTKQTE